MDINFFGKKRFYCLELNNYCGIERVRFSKQRRLEMKHMLAIALGVIGVALTLPALAGHHDDQDGMRGHQKMMFKMADTNGDGKISKEEFHAAHEKMFLEIDANHDGFIDMDEMDKAHQAHTDKMHEHMKQRGSDSAGNSDKSSNAGKK